MASVSDRIMNGFVNGDHLHVVSLLSQAESLKDMRAENFSFPIIDLQVHNVRLLNLAAWHGWLDIAGQLIRDYQCDPQSTDSNLATPLHYASRGGRLALVKFLLMECKCDLMAASYRGTIPLHYACQYTGIYMW